MRSPKWLVVCLGLLALALTGCPERDGPAERAGEAIDEAADEVEDAVD
jgi:hypothetical protein